LWAAFFAGMALMSGLRMALSQFQGLGTSLFDLIVLGIGSVLTVALLARR
jgi:hypothetical protein